MINVIVPIVEDVEGFSKFINRYSLTPIKFIVGVPVTLAKTLDIQNENAEIHYVEDGSKKEEIINLLNRFEREKGVFIVVRRPLTEEEFFSLCDSRTDVTTLKSHRSKFSEFFKNISNFLLRKIFGFNSFDDISAVAFSENMHEVVSSYESLSKATRINRYVICSCGEIETSEKSVKKEYSRPKNALLLTAGIGFLLLTIVGVSLIWSLVDGIKSVVNVLMICWIVVAFFVCLVSVMTFERVRKVGKLDYGYASTAYPKEEPETIEEESEESTQVVEEKPVEEKSEEPVKGCSETKAEEVVIEPVKEKKTATRKKSGTTKRATAKTPAKTTEKKESKKTTTKTVAKTTAKKSDTEKKTASKKTVKKTADVSKKETKSKTTKSKKESK